MKISIENNNDYNSTSINEMITENRVLLEKLSEAFKIKIAKEKELNNIIINLDSRFNWEREKITNSNNEIYYMNSKLREKDQIIENNSIYRPSHHRKYVKYTYNLLSLLF